jgi:hypothetical protein
LELTLQNISPPAGMPGRYLRLPNDRPLERLGERMPLLLLRLLLLPNPPLPTGVDELRAPKLRWEDDGLLSDDRDGADGRAALLPCDTV